MKATFRLGDAAADAEFCRAHQHLYHRICRLADNVAGFYLRADAHLIMPENAQIEGVPRFVGVTFDEEDDRAFERQVNALLTGRKFPPELPVPKFSVALEVEFPDGGKETFVFDFAAYSDEAIEAFCSAVCESARRRYRFRFAHAGNRRGAAV